MQEEDASLKERKMIMSIALRFGAASRPVRTYDCDTIFDETLAIRPEALAEIRQSLAARHDIAFELPSDTHEHWSACNTALREMLAKLKKDLPMPVGNVNSFRNVTFGRKA